MTWPGPLLPLVERHGAAAVWAAGLAALGYPPTWAMSGIEVSRIRRAMS